MILVIYWRNIGLISSGVEELFFNRNVTTAIKVGQARGVILLAAEQQRIPIYEYTPLQN